MTLTLILRERAARDAVHLDAALHVLSQIHISVSPNGLQAAHLRLKQANISDANRSGTSQASHPCNQCQPDKPQLLRSNGIFDITSSASLKEKCENNFATVVVKFMCASPRPTQLRCPWLNGKNRLDFTAVLYGFAVAAYSASGSSQRPCKI